MFNIKTYFIMSLIIIFILFNSCLKDYGTNVPDAEPFSLTFSESGGWIEGNRLTVQENDTVNLTNYSYNFSTKAPKVDLDMMHLVLSSNSFFSMDSVYLPDKYFTDATYYSITYTSASKSQTVLAEASCRNLKWPNGLENIVDYFRGYVSDLKRNINSGTVMILRKWTLEEWPFSDRLQLSHHIRSQVDIDAGIYTYVKYRSRPETRISFFEEEWIYDLRVGSRRTNPEEPKSYYITIGNKINPIDWPFESKLTDIPEEGIKLFGKDYFWIKEKLNEIIEPGFFIEGAVEPGESIYVLHLVNGNK